MKELADGKLVVARSYYYLLDWNDQNKREYILETFNKTALCELTFSEYKKLFDYATKQDKLANLYTKNK